MELMNAKIVDVKFHSNFRILRIFHEHLNLHVNIRKSVDTIGNVFALSNGLKTVNSSIVQVTLTEHVLVFLLHFVCSKNESVSLLLTTMSPQKRNKQYKSVSRCSSTCYQIKTNNLYSFGQGYSLLKSTSKFNCVLLN